jgi:hypothetical protein
VRWRALADAATATMARGIYRAATLEINDR